jgi:hypothetical protein
MFAGPETWFAAAAILLGAAAVVVILWRDRRDSRRGRLTARSLTPAGAEPETRPTDGGGPRGAGDAPAHADAMGPTASRYERKESRAPHVCRPPGRWRRWRDGVKGGAIWRCECGERFEFRPWERYVPSIGRPGQPRPGQPGFPYWWRIIEMGPPPSPAPARPRREGPT